LRLGPLPTRFGKTRRLHDEEGDPLVAALGHRSRGRLCGDDDDGQIDRTRHLGDAPVGLDPLDLGARRIDRIDAARKAVGQEVPHYV
jgi:hypothetical protein